VSRRAAPTTLLEALRELRGEIGVLLVLALAAGSAWGFIEIADEVMEGETRQVDERILVAMRTPGDLNNPIGPKWVEELGRDFTALGGVGVLTLLTLAAAGYLLMMRKQHAALLVLAAVGSGILASQLLKYGFDRPRPELVPHGSHVYTSSFPSGHSMMAALTYLTLGALLAKVHRGWRARVYLLTLAIVISLLVGVSRVYLGVHWPTDVLAGWSAGAFWALMCWQLANWLQRRGQIEPEGVETDG
jgi:undecaprenyl-diphosphatase